MLRDWLLTVSVRQNQKKECSSKLSQTYRPVHERSYLTSVDYGHVSDGDRGFLEVHEKCICRQISEQTLVIHEASAPRGKG
jgi:hypothetical protein